MTTTDAKQKKKLCDRMITELFYGTPEGTRTPSLQNRNLTLYPIELRAHTMLFSSLVIISGLPPVVKGKLKTFF